MKNPPFSCAKAVVNNLTDSLPPAVVLGLSPTGLHVVRELGRAGVVVSGVSDSLQAGCASRYLHEYAIDANPARRLDWLCSRFPVPWDNNDSRAVLIPTSDQDIDFVIAHYARLSRHFAMQLSYADGVAEKIMTKASFYELCHEKGVEYPQIWKGRLDKIGAFRDRIAYPCMIKPSRIQDVKEQMFGAKGWIVRDPMEFDRVLPRIPEAAGVLLLQEIVPGPESTITLWCGYIDGAGTVRQGYTARKLRQHPPGFGSASLVQSAAEEESQDIAERLLTGIGYRGLAAAEFKRDLNGHLKIIEINPRPSLWFAASSAAGRQPVLSAYYDLAGRHVSFGDNPQKNGVRWRYLLKDLWSAAFYRLRPAFLLGAPDITVVGPARKRVGAVFAWDDPAPALAECMNLVRKTVRRLRVWRRA